MKLNKEVRSQFLVSSLTELCPPFFFFLPLSAAAALTLFGGDDVGSSESLFVFLFLPEAVPEVSLGAEAAEPKERDRCFGGIFAECRSPSPLLLSWVSF